MANLGNTIINGALRVNGKINASDVISAPSFVGALTGNADSATKLKTARTINGTSFDGSANITTTNWGTARNIGIVNSDGTGTAVTVSVNGSGNVNLKLPATIKAALTGNAATATNATNIGITNTNPTSGTWYYPTWVTDTSGNLPERTNDGLRYYSLQGTTSALGHSYVQIGNATAAGTAGNKQGHLRIYSGSSGYVDLDVSTSTSNFTITLPAASGTVSLNGHTHSYLPLSGGNLTGRTTVQSAGQEIPTHHNTQFLIDTTLSTPNPSLGFREQGTSDGVLYMHQRALYWSSGAAIAGEVPAANTGYKMLHAGNFQNYAAPAKDSSNYVKVYGASVNGTNSETITPVDLAKKDYAMGMIDSATDNPWGEKTWNHIISMNWSKGSTSTWVSQIALGTQKGTGMFYRTTSGDVSGRAWTRVLDSSNYSNYIPMTYSGTSTPENTLGKNGDIYILLES